MFSHVKWRQAKMRRGQLVANGQVLSRWVRLVIFPSERPLELFRGEWEDRSGKRQMIYFAYSHYRKRLMTGPIQRENVDLASGMLEQLDRTAKELKISRQAVIKTVIRQALDQ
jgi:hypothetical protein